MGVTIWSGLTLFAVMVGLAAIPSSSVALVVLRSASLGVRSGVATAFGIAAGDLVFVALAIGGLTAVSQAGGLVFGALRYLAAGYLIWCGLSLIRSSGNASNATLPYEWGGSKFSFLAGAILTLGDIKAILFYAALFPSVVDVTALTPIDLITITSITVVAVAGVKSIYAVVARSIAGNPSLSASGAVKPAKIVAGSMMVGAGGFLILKP